MFFDEIIESLTENNYLTFYDKKYRRHNVEQLIIKPNEEFTFYLNSSCNSSCLDENKKNICNLFDKNKDEYDIFLTDNSNDSEVFLYKLVKKKTNDLKNNKYIRKNSLSLKCKKL